MATSLPTPATTLPETDLTSPADSAFAKSLALGANFVRWLLMALNLSCLDAPLVAVTWQAFAADVFQIQLSGSRVALLALAIWCAYAGDRWLDGFRLTSKSASPRHRFARRFRIEMAVVLFLGIAAALVIAGRELSGGIAFSSWLLAGTALVFIAGTFTSPTLFRARLPRELIVGSLVAAAVCLFPFEAPSESLFPKMVFAASIALLFATNGLVIARSEHPRDLLLGEASAATRWPRVMEKLRPFLWIAMATSATISLAAGFALSSAAPSVVLAILAIAFAGLLWVDRSKIATDLKPVAADLALLAPWLMLFYEL
ncbi:MAG: hypothetical protein V3W41_15865 [Planctomycetota bacterium]